MGLGCRSRPGPSPGQGSGDGGAGGRLAAAECRGRQQGERLYDWARWRLFRLHEQPWDHWLLVRRKISNPEELAYSVVFGPADTSLSTLAQVAGQRWRIEECFEAAKQEVGLADCEVRSWHGWYRHITLSMLALAFLAVMRVKINAEKGAPDPENFYQLPSVCRRSAGSLPASN